MMMITFHWNGFFSIDVWCFVWCSLDVDKERAEAYFLDNWKSIWTLHCRCVHFHKSCWQWYGYEDGVIVLIIMVIMMLTLVVAVVLPQQHEWHATGSSRDTVDTYLVSWVPLQRNNVTATVQAVAALIFPDTHTDRPTVVCRRLQLWVAWVGRF